MPNDHMFLQLALDQAQQALQLGEVPVGAVLVDAQGQVLAQTHNRTLVDCDPCAHAEILALRGAAQAAGNHRLQGCTLYVTLEPCAMCAGAMLHARLQRVVYAVADPKTGAAGSVLNVFADQRINHQTQAALFAPQHTADPVSSDALQTACTQLLPSFFAQLRAAQVCQSQSAPQAALRDDALRPSSKRFSHITALQTLQPLSQWALVHDRQDARQDMPTQRPWRLHYLDSCPHEPSRPTVVLLHGYACYSLLWSDVIAPLHNAGWRVLAPDLLGHGQSDQPKKVHQHSLHWHSALLQQWLEQLHITHSPHRVLLVHDSAVLLEAGLSPLFHHSLALAPFTANTASAKSQHLRPDMQWRSLCQRRASFDLDAFWDTNPEDQAQRAWSAPYPDTGHRAALQWPIWAGLENTPAHPDHSIQNHRLTTPPNAIPTTKISNGAALRDWLRHNSDVFLAHVQATQTAKN